MDHHNILCHKHLADPAGRCWGKAQPARHKSLPSRLPDWCALQDGLVQNLPFGGRRGLEIEPPCIAESGSGHVVRIREASRTSPHPLWWSVAQSCTNGVPRDVIVQRVEVGAALYGDDLVRPLIDRTFTEALVAGSPPLGMRPSEPVHESGKVWLLVRHERHVPVIREDRPLEEFDQESINGLCK